MKKLINVSLGGAVALLACLFVSSAWANSVQMQCPGSVLEGGLIKIGTYDRCVHAGDNLGAPYCEYRDIPGKDDWEPEDVVSAKRKKSAYITISATDGGEWNIWAGHPLITEKISGSAGTLRYQVDAGTTREIEIKVYGRGNYRKEGTISGTVYVAPPGMVGINDVVASCVITVEEDDNTAYAGKTYHKYGGTWQSAPKCYVIGCASWR